MRLRWSRRFLVTLGLSLALTLAAVSPAAAVSTLTGESLSGSSSSGNTGGCITKAATYSVSGEATGPYPGTFSETGSVGPGFFDFTATFTITSGTTTITGSKTTASSTSGSLGCSSTFAGTTLTDVAYTATIHAPGGTFHDEGTSNVDVNITRPAATLTEGFTSSLTEPVLTAPSTKDQCKNGGWQNYPQPNQGQCEKSVTG
jgi:hypothetical protein